jgi:hypothetical protein
MYSLKQGEVLELLNCCCVIKETSQHPVESFGHKAKGMPEPPKYVAAEVKYREAQFFAIVFQ